MKTLTIFRYDLKNIFRDPSMLAILIAPLAMLVILRIAPPLYEPYFPVMVEYRPLILAVFSILITALSGFLMAFVMLDEKDQHLFDVFRILPFTFKQLIGIRILFMFLLGFVLCASFIPASGMLDLNIFQIVSLSVLAAISGPANTLLIVSISNNKIEGATYFKGLNMFIMAPLAAIFIASPLRYLIGIIPFFWVFASFTAYQQPLSFGMHVGIGIICNLLYLGAAYLLLIRKTQ
ncbi:MAG: hypothetical protein JW801_08485 [Bacteroidales bacterium]|nr:hypothetical protein [Bacteroidales bacterium]